MKDILTFNIPPTPLQRGSKENPPLREVSRTYFSQKISAGRRMFGLILMFVFIVAPLFVHAAPIVPCGIDDAVARGLDAKYAEPCGFNHFLIGVNNVINFLIMITGSVAAVVFAIAGLLILTAGTNEGQVTKAKEMFWSVLKGFVWILSAWLLVKTVLAGLGVPAAFSLLEN